MRGRTIIRGRVVAVLQRAQPLGELPAEGFQFAHAGLLGMQRLFQRAQQILLCKRC